MVSVIKDIIVFTVRFKNKITSLLKEKIKRFEVQTAVIVMALFFRNDAACSLVEMYRRFGGMYCPKLQDGSEILLQTSINLYQNAWYHIP